MSMFATQADYWKARAELAEQRLTELRAKVFTSGDRRMTMDGRTFTVEGDGFILDNNFDFDAGMQVSGDFVDDEKRQYAEMIAAALNSLPPNAELNGARRASDFSAELGAGG